MMKREEIAREIEPFLASVCSDGNSDSKTLARNIADHLFDRCAIAPPEPTEGLREALTLAEDVLSRAPFSTQIWPNGMHPNEGIALIRAALRAMPLQDHAVTQDKRHD